MRWLRRTWEKYIGSIRGRTMLMVLLMTVCALALAASVFLLRYHKDMTDAYRKQVRLHLKDMDVVFTGYLDHAAAICQSWFQSPDGKLARLEEEYNPFEHMRFVRQVQSALQSSPWIHSAYFFAKDGGIALCVKNGGSLSRDMDDVLQERIRHGKGGNWNFAWNIEKRYEQGTTAFLTLCSSDTAYGSKRWTGAVALNIDLRQLRREILAQDASADGSVFILDAQGTVVLHSDEKEIGQDWSEETFAAGSRSGEGKMIHTALQGKNVEMMEIPSRKDGFSVFSQSAPINSRFWMKALSFALLLFPAAMLLVYALALAVGKSIFRPLNQTMDSMRKSGILASGEGADEKNELLFLQKYAAYIDQYMEQVRKKEERESILRVMMSGDGNRQMEKMLLDAGMLRRESPCVAVTVAFYSRRESWRLEEVEQISERVRKEIVSELEKDGRAQFFRYGLHELLFLISTEGNGGESRSWESVQRAWQKLRDLTEETELYGCISPEMIVGDGTLKETIRKNNEHLSTLRLCRREIILLREKTEKGDVPGEEKAQRIAQMLREGKRQAYFDAVEALLEELKTVRRTEFTWYLARMSRQMLKIKSNMSVESMLPGEDELYENLRRLENRQELLEWFEWLYDDVKEKLDEARHNSSAQMMEEAVKYIREHFDDFDLDVTMMAQRMHISPQYFSQMFRAFTGVSAANYIIQVRMEKARDYLLTRPDMEIMQIARKTGYHSPGYFSTAFRKYYGLAPTELRASLHFQEEQRDCEGLST